VRLRHAGPQVLICTDGAVELSNSDGATLRLGRGDSAWLSAADCAAGPVLARPAGGGRVQLFRATAGAV
jgi:mannose-6-phosphate isomerase